MLLELLLLLLLLRKGSSVRQYYTPSLHGFEIAHIHLHDRLAELGLRHIPNMRWQHIEDFLTHPRIQLRSSFRNFRYSSGRKCSTKEALREWCDEKVRRKSPTTRNLPIRNGILSTSVRGRLQRHTMTYAGFIPQQLDQLPIAVFICPRSSLNVHNHRLMFLHPLLEFIH